MRFFFKKNAISGLQSDKSTTNLNIKHIATQWLGNKKAHDGILLAQELTIEWYRAAI